MIVQIIISIIVMICVISDMLHFSRASNGWGYIAALLGISMETVVASFIVLLVSYGGGIK